MKDLLGIALQDYTNGRYTEDLVTLSSLDQKEVLPLPYLFRNYQEMSILEQKALQLCFGRILDVGCGAGSHSLFLQETGFNVTALDQSMGAVATAKQRGVKQVVQSSFLDFSGTGFDTLLFLMNGIGIAERLAHLGQFLQHCKKIMKPNGQILMDSSDIIYMYDQDEDGGFWVDGHQNYYGEVQFQWQYKNQKSNLFNWLYLDFNTLSKVADQQNFNCELVSEGQHYDYLAKLSLTK